jgi:adenylyltransferase/sulfurtransferase
MTTAENSQTGRRERYSRQTLFPGIGPAGQEKLLAARVCVVGCGALGTAQAETLARAGVGGLRIVDRDFVELSNLHRQTLYTERDARERLPKAIAAAQHLAKINSEVAVTPEVADVNHSNVERLIAGCNLVLDGTDNFATRYLLNDACVKHNINWIYGAAVSSYGVTMTIRPRLSPCLRCVFPEEPDAATAPTCDTAGVIQPIIATVVAAQITEALKLLAGHTGKLHQSLLQFDLWANDWRRIRLREPAPDCPACALNQFPALSAENRDFAAVLCGRNAVQIAPPRPTLLDLPTLADKLRPAGEVKANGYLVRFANGPYEITVFSDARAIIRGTDDVTIARSLYAKYVGS